MKCLGQCKQPSSHDYLSEVLVLPERWVFILHDKMRCPQMLALRMENLRKNLKKVDGGRTTEG